MLDSIRDRPWAAGGADFRIGFAVARSNENKRKKSRIAAVRRRGFLPNDSEIREDDRGGRGFLNLIIKAVWIARKGP